MTECRTSRLRQVARPPSSTPTKPDYLADIYAATDRVYALLRLPDERPGAWKVEHVRALEEPLCQIIDALRAERPGRLKGDRVTGDPSRTPCAGRWRPRPRSRRATRATTIYRDRVVLLAVDHDGGRWRIHVMTEPWAAPAA